MAPRRVNPVGYLSWPVLLRNIPGVPPDDERPEDSVSILSSSNNRSSSVPDFGSGFGVGSVIDTYPVATEVEVISDVAPEAILISSGVKENSSAEDSDDLCDVPVFTSDLLYIKYSVANNL